MRNSIFILFVGMILSLTSCRKDFDTVQNTGSLEFSKSTVYLDTVFTNIGSSTYMLKVYNRSKDDIVIPTIKLGKGDSKYRIMVDGMTGNGGTGKVFSNVELLAKDSLFIFIETTASVADADPADFLYTDEIQFYGGSNYQKVDLVTLIQDAVFLYPNRELPTDMKETLTFGGDAESSGIEGHELQTPNELHWTAQKPYVIYGYAMVPNNKTLVIDPGARVHFHSESGLIVDQLGTLKINESNTFDTANPMLNEVVFEGDRLEPMYSDIPGQWGTVWLRGTNSTNIINHLTLKNAVVGLLVDQSTLSINSSQIYDMSNVGILARTATITGTNLALNTAGQANLACTYGGNYSFKHCTFNNNWANSNQVAVTLSNYIENDEGTFDYQPLNQADFFNCIIYGSNRVELFLDKGKDAATAFNYNFNHCLVKFNDEGVNIPNPELYAQIKATATATDGNYIELNPGFENIEKNKLNISAESNAAGKANPTYLLPFDILGISRTKNDLGAYQSM